MRQCAVERLRSELQCGIAASLLLSVAVGSETVASSRWRAQATNNSGKDGTDASKRSSACTIPAGGWQRMAGQGTALSALQSDTSKDSRMSCLLKEKQRIAKPLTKACQQDGEVDGPHAAGAAHLLQLPVAYLAAEQAAEDHQRAGDAAVPAVALKHVREARVVHERLRHAC